MHVISGVRGGLRKMRRARFCFPRGALATAAQIDGGATYIAEHAIMLQIVMLSGVAFALNNEILGACRAAQLPSVVLQVEEHARHGRCEGVRVFAVRLVRAP